MVSACHHLPLWRNLYGRRNDSLHTGQRDLLESPHRTTELSFFTTGEEGRGTQSDSSKFGIDRSLTNHTTVNYYDARDLALERI